MKAIITGSNGLLGSALKKELGEGHHYHTRKDCDLTDINAIRKYFNSLIGVYEKPVNTLIHSAAKVGGVNANMQDNHGFFIDNLTIDRNVLNLCSEYNIPNVVTILSTCVFPDKATYPLTVDQIDAGKPHSSNYGYSYAKRLLAYETKIFRNFTENNWISVIPTNLFGPNDNFNLEKSHIIPALIRKAYEAKINDTDFVVWGSGDPLRQFVFSEDMSKVILWAIDNWKQETPLIAVDEKEYSIKEIAHIIAEKFQIPSNKIIFDSSKPEGQFRKPAKSDITDWKFTPLEEGISYTIDWFLKNYDTIRK